MAASIRRNFAANLRRLLKQAGLTQKQFAIAISASEASVSAWLHEMSFPEDFRFDVIRRVYGWNFTDLVADPEFAIRKTAGPTPLLTIEQRKLLEAIERFADAAGYEFRKKKPT